MGKDEGGVRMTCPICTYADMSGCLFLYAPVIVIMLFFICLALAWLWPVDKPKRRRKK